MITDLKKNTAFHTLNISAGGLMAQRRRLDAIAQNMANINTTRTAEGGPYKPKITTFNEAEDNPAFYKLLEQERLDLDVSHQNHLLPDLKWVERKNLSGVESEVVESDAPPRMEYDPDHPDADENGYVAYPDLNLVQEMTELLLATREYEANVTVVKGAKQMAAKGMEI